MGQLGMKKIIVIISLCLGLLVSITSCAPEPEPKTICLKEHSWNTIEYGYGFTISGKMGWGFINKYHYECLKYGPNPRYTNQ